MLEVCLVWMSQHKETKKKLQTVQTFSCSIQFVYLCYNTVKVVQCFFKP